MEAVDVQALERIREWVAKYDPTDRHDSEDMHVERDSLLIALLREQDAELAAKVEEIERQVSFWYA